MSTNMKQKFPDYKNSLVSLANSILEKFGAGEGGQGLSLLDEYMKNDYENIVVLLLDGMGECILKNNLTADGFLIRTWWVHTAPFFHRQLWRRPLLL